MLIGKRIHPRHQLVARGLPHRIDDTGIDDLPIALRPEIDVALRLELGLEGRLEMRMALPCGLPDPSALRRIHLADRVLLAVHRHVEPVAEDMLMHMRLDAGAISAP